MAAFTKWLVFDLRFSGLLMNFRRQVLLAFARLGRKKRNSMNADGSQLGGFAQNS